MDRGLLILLSLAGLLVISVVLEIIGILPAIHIKAIMIISLLYHTGYTIYAMVEWNGRTRIRNKKRGNLRPPRSSREKW